MLLELAIGDAYGAGFEYADELVNTHNTLAAYVSHPRHQELRPGCYTDDTQMSLAIAEALLADEPWTREQLARRFVEAFHRDPRAGYARRFYAFLQETRTGEAFLAGIRPSSDKSGAAMRACPVGVLPSAARVLEACALQARLTHDTPDGVAAAQAASLMAHYCYHGLGPKAGLPDFLGKLVPGPWDDPWKGKVGAQGMMAVRAALTAVLAHDSLSAILRACVAFRGDVDTVAAIAMGVAAGCREVAQDLPERLVAGLENGPYGRDYLWMLEARLRQRYPSRVEA